MQAEVCHINQMAWHLNMLPGSKPSLKDIKLDKLHSFPLSMGRKREGHAYGALSNAHGTSVEVDYTACCRGQCYRWRIVVLAPNLPLSPKLTLSKHSRFRCFWSLIAIHPGCPKLLLHPLWCVCGTLNLSKYHPQANSVQHRPLG